jgi:polyferredoxin
MLNIVRWLLLVSFVATGLYLLAWAFQSASFSVPAETFMSEIYKSQALLLLPLSILFCAVGVLFFICLRKKQT